MKTIILIALMAGLTACGNDLTELAPHNVVSDDSLAPKDGQRIQINVSDSALRKEECAALIDHYSKRAGKEGQVSVHKPSTLPSLKGATVVFCVENFDGKGVVFHNYYFK